MLKNLQRGQSIGIVGIGIALIAVVIVIGLSLAPVKFGTVKAVTFAGGLSGAVYQQGLNFKAPWQGTRTFNVQRQTYETSQNPGTSLANFTDYAIEAKTSDGQSIEVSYTVIFRVASGDVTKVLEDYGSMEAVVENIVKAKSRSEARKSAQNYEAGSLYSGIGIRLYEAEVSEILVESYLPEGVTLVEFLIRDISFEPAYVDAITAKQIAAENIVTQRNNALAATHQAQGKVNLATGDAEAIRVLAGAQADAIALQGAALATYPAMTQWEFVQNLEDVTWGFLPADGITPLIPLPTP